jgi:hypothetical protein
MKVCLDGRCQFVRSLQLPAIDAAPFIVGQYREPSQSAGVGGTLNDEVA